MTDRTMRASTLPNLIRDRLCQEYGGTWSAFSVTVTEFSNRLEIKIDDVPTHFGPNFAFMQWLAEITGTQKINVDNVEFNRGYDSDPGIYDYGITYHALDPTLKLVQEEPEQLWRDIFREWRSQ